MSDAPSGPGSEITAGSVTTPRHRTAYLAAGPVDGPLVLLVHGWPERAISWRHQLAHLGALGYRAVAPDMRGYGGSTVHPERSDYAMEPIVDDVLELLAHLGRTEAAWVGHDWGSPVVWSVASHHPEVCTRVASLCVPYQPGGFTIESMVPLVDRDLYPADEFPVGQWDYFLHYREDFDAASAAFEADVERSVKVLFRRGDPGVVGVRSPLASVRRRGGWFGSAGVAPDREVDEAVLDEVSFRTYVDGLRRNGFRGPDSWYVNDEPNADYAARSVDGGRLSMPVLFLHARYDQVCATIGTRLADPMRAACAHLTEEVVDSGHWMAQECPDDVNRALATFLR